MVDRFDPEELLTCPYDPVHRIARKRIQGHLIKCRKNYNTGGYSVCPFNAKHVVPRPELPYHISTCEDRSRVEMEIYHNSSIYKSKGDTSVPIHDWKPPSPDEESWDDDNVKYVPKQSTELHDSQNPVIPSEGSNISSSVAPPIATTNPKSTYNPPPTVRMPSKVDSQNPVYNFSTTSTSGRGRAKIDGHGPIVTGPPPGFGRGRGLLSLEQHNGPTAMPKGLANGYGSTGNGIGDDRIGSLSSSVQSSLQDVSPVQCVPTMELKEPSPSQDEEELKILKKKVRKLSKMLKQIHEIEARSASGGIIIPDQVAKVKRKGDVELSLAQAIQDLRLVEQKLSS